MKRYRLILLAIPVFLVALNLDQKIAVPKIYYAQKTIRPPVIDGVLDDSVWQSVPFSDDFTDISTSQTPQFRTRMKMLWNDSFLYIGAQMQEPHLWANLTQDETVIFYDNDFEVFIDPDGDNHNYYEFEFNQLNKKWDLFLPKPYRDGGPAINEFNCSGLQHAVHLNGTLNQPDDTDQGWSIEIAIPLKSIAESVKNQTLPTQGSVWRINFSRVEWETEIQNRRYVKKKMPEHNWVWTPQYAINMHRPEYWGYLIFSGEETPNQDDSLQQDFQMRMTLMDVYYQQKEFYKTHHRYASFNELNLSERILIHKSPYQFTATVINNGMRWHINQNSKLWHE